MKVPLVHLEHDKDFKPKQPPSRNVPIHYQSEVSKLLDFRYKLRKATVFSKVDMGWAFHQLLLDEERRITE